MQLTAFSVYDSKVEAFIQPFFAPKRAVGLRLFKAACNNESADFNRFAADYTLFELGEFNQETAEFILHPSPVNLGVALTFIDPKE